ncbi:glutathione synthase [Candidatus Marinamargulisbacteria bacterium SCGC AG-439-L15]|nr:glutathione synthase [Candidatus Marinamargulisbacteria bacterium SCGC AG-439-L15]
MNIVFIMDALETVIPEKDTTLAFMRAAQSRGHRLFYVPKTGLSYQSEVLFQASEVQVMDKGQSLFETKETVSLSETEVDVVMIRPDPPFDETYLHLTWILDRLNPRVFVMNRPNGIRSVNEKLWALQFSEFMPPTLVTSDHSQFKSFLAEHQKVVIKPCNGYGGQGVFILSMDDLNVNAAFELLSKYGKEAVICQQYLEDAQTGDKRILLLNGESLGTVLRVHSDDDHRNNFFAGGKAISSEITDRDREIIDRLKPHLLDLGLYFVGIDIIGDYLIEVNVTSPTCLQEMNRLYDKCLETDVIVFIESAVSKLNKE